MSDKKQKDGYVTSGRAHANDNEPAEASTYTSTNKVTYGSDAPGDGANVTKRSKAKIKVSFNDWPDTLPVLSDELALIEAYLPDLINTIVANDN
jgi:hypothetical protein